MASRLDHVSASDLDLWMVDNLGHVNHSKLSPPLLKLSHFFKHVLDDECLHIIAKAPGMSLLWPHV